MKPSTQLDNLLKYTAFAANIVRGIARSFEIPFLGSTAVLVLAILKCVESIKSNKDVCIEIVEQIHEILGTVVTLHSTSEIKGVLPTALLDDIAKFTEILEKVFTLLKQQKSMGKIKQFFEQRSNAERLEACRQELNHTLEMFKIRATSLTLSQLVQMRKDAKQCHEDLVALLESNLDLTSCEHSSVIGALPDMANSSESLSMLPPSPKVFHGRDSELNTVLTFLLQEFPRIAILGTGGMGKTTLAIAAVQNAQVESKYSQRYFVPCQSTPTCLELVSMIAAHLSLAQQSNLLRTVIHYFKHAPPSLLVLDNFETPWEPNSSRSEVEEFLSLLADISQLALVITMRGAERPAKTFFDVADNIHEEGSVNQLLELTGNLPLAISLIASVAGAEGCDSALARWKSESTRMLSDGFDKRSSLDISIMLSFTSSRMTPRAQDLLSILSMLPDGFTDADLLQAELPIPDILASKTTLLRTALAFVDKET
ncbi:P-loop containing nucleoside triphosphate hydrolase protein [Mycena rebaudengoi]|nr:P-loop containing nucleoside triphosphate hydrolase protein [Mycena rebaudengoi]